jgi:uncharacterized protein (TIGR02246 family)
MMRRTQAILRTASNLVCFLATCIALLASPVSAVECVPAANSDFVDALDKWNAAVVTGHPDKVTRLYALHATLMPANGTMPRIGYDAIRHHFLYLLPDAPSVHVLKREIRIGCEIAIDSGIYLVSTGPKNARRTEKQRFTFIYTRYDETWLIEHHHASLLMSDPVPMSQHKPAVASVGKILRTPAVAGYLFRAPDKLKLQSRRAAKPSASAADESDYRAGTWIDSAPVFQE